MKKLLSFLVIVLIPVVVLSQDSISIIKIDKNNRSNLIIGLLTANPDVQKVKPIKIDTIIESKGVEFLVKLSQRDAIIELDSSYVEYSELLKKHNKNEFIDLVKIFNELKLIGVIPGIMKLEDFFGLSYDAQKFLKIKIYENTKK
jgi:transcriptional regulatory protein LevR